jgi:DNA-binding beta-propeller fold protein YncE
MLRVPRAGGVARVSAYPNVDSTVWAATDASPAMDHILAFDADAGLIAGVDSRGLPVWLDLRIGSVAIPNRGKLHSVASVNGTTVYAVGADGAVARFTPSGSEVLKTPLPARQAFPQVNGTLLVLGGRGASTTVWRTHPPETRLLDSLSMPDVVSGIGSPLGDRVYFLSGRHTLTGVSSRTLVKGAPIELEHTVISTVATPSGDRFYVLTDSSETLSVIDRFQDRVSARISLPGRPRDLRVDPFGRYVLVRAFSGDSVWIVGIGTNTVVGTVRSTWRSDLPLVTADGAIAVVAGRDVAFIDASTRREVRRAAGGASDFWYPFVWSGLRPRAAVLDRVTRPVADSDTTRRPPAPVTGDSVLPRAAMPAPDSVKVGFSVSFAALLNEAKARELAARIIVDGQTARVITNLTDGTAVYRVVLGPFATRDDADRVGRASGQTYYVFAGSP